MKKAKCTECGTEDPTPSYGVENETPVYWFFNVPIGIDGEESPVQYGLNEKGEIEYGFLCSPKKDLMVEDNEKPYCLDCHCKLFMPNNPEYLPFKS